MNDFTKEELKLLDFALSIINLWGSAYGDLRKTDGNKLRSKIQSMIDNYCEHESESISSWGIIKSCEGDINKPFKCKKCGEFYR